MFMVSIVFLVLLTVFEASFSGMPVTAERIISGLVLVLPGILGAIFGLLSLLLALQLLGHDFLGPGFDVRLGGEDFVLLLLA